MTQAQTGLPAIPTPTADQKLAALVKENLAPADYGARLAADPDMAAVDQQIVAAKQWSDAITAATATWAALVRDTETVLGALRNDPTQPVPADEQALLDAVLAWRAALAAPPIVAEPPVTPPADPAVEGA